MKIIDIFYSIQGEQLGLGQPSVFVRLAGCNLKCDYCDTKYSWSKGKKMTVKQVITEVKKYNCHNIIITGGEPLLQQREVELLIKKLRRHTITVETNGTIEPCVGLCVFVDIWNISPKFGTEIKNMYGTIYKFVVSDDKELDIIKDFQAKHKINKQKIYLMPKSSSREEYLKVAPIVWELCLKHGYNFSPREHIVLFDKERRK